MKYEVGGPERYSHQKKGLNWIISHKGIAALLMDPGTGKTSVAIDYAGLLALKMQTNEVRVLVACPTAATDTWVTQTRIFASPSVSYWAEALGGSITERVEAMAARGGHPYTKSPRTGATLRYRKNEATSSLHFRKSLALSVKNVDGTEVNPKNGIEAVKGPRIVLVVVNIDTFSRREQVRSKRMSDVVLDGIKRFQPDLFILDESHRVKRANSNTARLIARAGAAVPRRLILTGTVMPRSPVDIYSQWRFLEPTVFGIKDPITGEKSNATLAGFLDRYAIFGGWMGNEIVGYDHLDELQELMSLNAIVVKKEDAIDLPPTIDTIIPVHLSNAEQIAYDSMRKKLCVQLDSVDSTVTSRLTQHMRLRQITAGHLKDDDGTVRIIGDSKVSTIKSLVQDTLTQESRIVIFAQFTVEIEMLAKALSDSTTDVEVITGKTPMEDRKDIRSRFASDDPRRIVLIAQIKTISVAVNELVAANHAIFASLSSQREDWIQARDRLNRIGQTKPVTFWYALVPGTIDEVILESHKNRTKMEHDVLRHIKELNT